MIKQLSIRQTYLAGLIVITLLLGLAAYLQFHDGITPCPLCILQRISMIILGLIFFSGAIFNFKKIGRVIIGFLALLFAAFGTFFSGRQVWLQHLPPSQNADCGVSLQYMLQVLPPSEVFKKILHGSAECSRTDWQFLHLSLAEWSLFFFVIFMVFSLWQMLRKK